MSVREERRGREKEQVWVMLLAELCMEKSRGRLEGDRGG